MSAREPSARFNQCASIRKRATCRISFGEIDLVQRSARIGHQRQQKCLICGIAPETRLLRLRLCRPIESCRVSPFLA